MKFSDIFIFKSQFLALAVSWNGGFLSIFGLDIKLGLLDKVSVNPHLIFFNFFCLLITAGGANSAKVSLTISLLVWRQVFVTLSGSWWSLSRLCEVN